MREGSAEWVQLQTDARVFKGAPITILFIMLGLGRPVGVQELCRLLDKGHAWIEAGLGLLEVRGYVQRLAYHGGWSMAKKAAQLSFFRKLADYQQVDNSGGGGGLNEEESSISITTTTTPALADYQQVDVLLSPKEGLPVDNWHLPVDNWHLLVDKLTVLGGLSAHDGEAAVKAALLRGETPDDLRVKIAALTAYAFSSKGRGLKLPGAWAADFVKRGYAAPDLAGLPHAGPDDPLDRFDGYMAEVPNAQND